MKVRVHVSNGMVGCERTIEIEIDDDKSEDEIEELAKEAMFEMIEWWWEPA
jgi:hypothetical protein